MKDFYSFFNSTGGELPNAQPLDDGEVNKYMKEFADRTETRKKVPFVYKSLIAASLAVLVAVGGTFGYSRLTHTQREPFVITVNAEEITPNGSSFSVQNQAIWEFILDSHNNMEFKYSFDLQCEGDDIESVTYTLDLDKDKIDLNDRYLHSEDTADEYRPLPEVKKTPSPDGEGYTSITVDYDEQREYGLPVVLDGNGLFQQSEFSDDPEIEYDNILHCTVQYSDGTTSQQDIRLGFELKKDRFEMVFTLITEE